MGIAGRSQINISYLHRNKEHKTFLKYLPIFISKNWGIESKYQKECPAFFNTKVLFFLTHS